MRAAALRGTMDLVFTNAPVPFVRIVVSSRCQSEISISSTMNDHGDVLSPLAGGLSLASTRIKAATTTGLDFTVPY